MTVPFELATATKVTVVCSRGTAGVDARQRLVLLPVTAVTTLAP